MNLDPAVDVAAVVGVVRGAVPLCCADAGLMRVLGLEPFALHVGLSVHFARL